MVMRITTRQSMNADEWVNKYVISAGVVDYYHAYKQSFINKSLEL